MADVKIRPYRPEDRDDVYDVCVRTADAGADASGRFRDPEILGDLFAGPYVFLAPEFAFVLDDGERVSGYVLGVPDTSRFAEQLRDVWLPMVGDRYPAPAGPPADADEEMAALLHRPERFSNPALADYPAHLHIDLLPAFQRTGWGTKLMRTLLTALHDAGVPRVYLAMLTTNTGAAKFYERLGFYPLDVPDPGPITYLGRSTQMD